jgi:hypothetical protein
MPAARDFGPRPEEEQRNVLCVKPEPGPTRSLFTSESDSLKWHWDQGAVYILELAMDSDSGATIPPSVSSQRRLAG